MLVASDDIYTEVFIFSIRKFIPQPNVFEIISRTDDQKILDELLESLAEFCGQSDTSDHLGYDYINRKKMRQRRIVSVERRWL